MQTKDLYCYNKHYNQVFELLNAGECLSIVAQPHIGKSRILKEYAERNNKKVVFLELNDIPDYVKSNEKHDIVVIKKLYLTDSFEYRYKIKLIEDYRLKFKNRFSIVYYFKLDPRLSPSLVQLRTLCTNVITLSVDIPFFRFLISQNEQRFNIKLNQKEKDMLFILSGMNPLLLKQGFVNKISNKPLEDNMLNLAKNILDEYSKFELNIIKKGLNNYTQELISIQKTGLVEEKNFNSSVIGEVFLKHKVDKKLIIGINKLLLNKVDITSSFTQREFSFLSYIIKNSFISRDKVAEILSGKSNITNASEASIDKFISRIREKLDSFNIHKYIITFKKRGYYANSTMG